MNSSLLITMKMLTLFELSMKNALEPREQVISIYIYIVTSMARTPMARLPWMIRTLFSVPKNPSNSLRKQIYSGFFLILSWTYMLCVLIRGDSNEYTQHTVIV